MLSETTFIQLKKACANLWSVALSMTKYLLHGLTYNTAELLHLCGLMHSALHRALIHTRATILQCCMPYHAISIYCQAAMNLSVHVVNPLQTWLIETEGNMGLMICLAQRGLRSLSASRWYHSFLC